MKQKKARYEVIQGEMLKKFKDKDRFIANVGYVDLPSLLKLDFTNV